MNQPSGRNNWISRTGKSIASAARAFRDTFYGAEQSPNRGAKSTDTRPDHYALTRSKRLTMGSSLLNSVRNYSLARWAIRQDQNWVADCRFKPCSGDPFVDEQMAAIAEEMQDPLNFDFAGRIGVHEFARIVQGQRTLFGDVGILFCRDFGGTIKTISYDLIDHPQKPHDLWLQGVEVDAFSTRAKNYAIRKRDVLSGRPGDLWRIIPAEQMLLHRYAENEPDSVRGTTLFSTAVDRIVDTYETITYMGAKVKLGQVLGLILKRKAADRMPGRQYDEHGNEIKIGEAKAEDWEWNTSGGTFQLNLDHNDTAEFIESKAPSPENMKLIEWCCRDSLKALDIPYCWWDGSSQNFYGSIGETNLYKKASQHRRKTHIMLMQRVFRFKLQMAIIAGRLILPPGWTIDDCKFRIVPYGVSWFKPTEEVSASIQSILWGLSSLPKECEKLGTDAEENIRETLEVVAKFQGNGLPGVPFFGNPPQTVIQVPAREETPEKPDEKPEKQTPNDAEDDE